MSLAKFVAQENIVASIFNTPAYDIKNLSTEDKETLSKRLSSSLSPEALTCDGELRGAKLQAKAKLLRAAKAELEQMGVAVEEW